MHKQSMKVSVAQIGCKSDRASDCVRKKKLKGRQNTGRYMYQLRLMGEILETRRKDKKPFKTEIVE